MKPIQSSPLIIVCTLALLLPSAAFAVDTDKRMDKLDRNEDGRISRAEHSAHAERLFSKIDDDGDDVITLSELREWKNRDDKDAKRDADGRDRRNRLERDSDDGETAAERFKELDQNEDDRVTASEYSKSAKKRFDKLDNNNDGAVSESELEEAHD